MKKVRNNKSSKGLPAEIPASIRVGLSGEITQEIYEVIFEEIYKVGISYKYSNLYPGESLKS